MNEYTEFDLVSAKDYLKTAQYHHALVEMHMKLNSKEYREARRAVARQLRAQADAEQVAKTQAEFEKTKKNISLSEGEKSRIHTEAAAAAAKEYSSGRISASDIESRTAALEEELIEKRKISAATAQHFNQLLRGQF